MSHPTIAYLVLNILLPRIPFQTIFIIMTIFFLILGGSKNKTSNKAQLDLDTYKISTKPVEPQITAQPTTGDANELDLQVNKV